MTPKITLAGLAFFLLTFISSNAQKVSDFYGTWVGSDTTGVKYELTLNEGNYSLFKRNGNPLPLPEYNFSSATSGNIKFDKNKQTELRFTATQVASSDIHADGTNQAEINYSLVSIDDNNMKMIMYIDFNGYTVRNTGNGKLGKAIKIIFEKKS